MHPDNARADLASVEAAFAKVEVLVTYVVMYARGLGSPLREN